MRLWLVFNNHSQATTSSLKRPARGCFTRIPFLKISQRPLWTETYCNNEGFGVLFSDVSESVELMTTVLANLTAQLEKLHWLSQLDLDDGQTVSARVIPMRPSLQSNHKSTMCNWTWKILLLFFFVSGMYTTRHLSQRCEFTVFFSKSLRLSRCASTQDKRSPQLLYMIDTT